MGRYKKYLAFEDSREIFEFIFLSGLLGVIFLFLWIRLNPGNISYKLTLHEDKKVVFRAYLISWMLFPVLGIITAGLINLWKAHRPKLERPFFYTTFIFWNVFFAIFLLNPNEVWFFHGGRFTCAFLLAQMAAFYSLKMISRLSWPFLKIDRLLYALVAFFAVVWLVGVHWKDFVLTDWRVENYLVFFVVVLTFHFGITVFNQKENDEYLTCENKSVFKVARTIAAYVLVFILIFFLVFDTQFTYFDNHYWYYLGPLADLSGGKSLLFNVNAQYGVFVFYFLKMFFNFLPLGFTSFSFLNLTFITLQFFIFYFIARQLFVGEIIPLFSVLMLLLINNYGTVGHFNDVPSTGPLRFGFAYILMVLILLRNRYPALRNALLFLEAVVIGVAFFWSFEVCFYTVPAYFLFIFYESLMVGKGIQFDWNLLKKRIEIFIACVLLIGVYLYTDIYLKTHELPHWNYYFDYIFLYQGGFGMEGLHVPGFWWVIVGTLYFSCFVIFAIWLQKYRNGKLLPPELNAIFFLTVYGIFQYFYYLGRSNANNLFHVSMPATVLCIYWLYYLRRFDPASVPGVFKKTGFSLVVVLIGFYIQPIVPTAIRKIKEQMAPLPVMVQRIESAVHDLPRDDAYANRVLRLMKKYSGDQKRLVYFLGDQGVDVALYGKRLKVYPYNDWEQANICDPTLNRVLAFDPHLKVGDYIYYDLDQISDNKASYGGTPCFEDKLLSKIKKAFQLKIVEKDHSIVVAEVVKARVE